METESQDIASETFETINHGTTQQQGSIQERILSNNGDPVRSTTGRNNETGKRRQLYVLEGIRQEYETNIEALEARTRIGERGLGSLARQLHDIQVAMKRREGEIQRLVLETDRERIAKLECERMIETVKRTE
ncbi:hypothetical protein LTS12_027352 [Elasticomyces elasticus]|nr:hypothetical protein LTS12_027352 [Elasticomyces elasticus]